MIYEADTRMTIAADDGTTFRSISFTDVPASFSTLTEGFSDAYAEWYVGSAGSAALAFDGRIESLVIHDRALSLAEADAISLIFVPEPHVATSLLLGAAIVWWRRRKKNATGPLSNPV
jgi:hypothetical protein